MVNGVGYNYRVAPLVRHAADLIGSGRLGDLTHFRGQRSTIMQFVVPYAGTEAEAWDALTAAVGVIIAVPTAYALARFH